MDAQTGLRVFFSYSHEDESYLDRLRTHLANLREEGLIRDWHDRAIRPGDEWQAAISEQLDQADVILLLISADFNNSEFCRRVEMARAIERHNAGSARVIPVVVRPVETLPAEIAHVQAVPKDLKPIVSFQSRDEGYVQVARELRSLLADFTPSGGRTADSQDRTTTIDLPPTRPVEVCCIFEAAGDAYRLEIHIGFDGGQSVSLPRPVRLGKTEPLRLDVGIETTLGDIVAWLQEGRWEQTAWLEERGQLEIGRKLFDETVATMEPLANCDEVDLRIATDDPHLLALPWPLLNRSGIFLIQGGWSMSVSTGSQPPEPVILPSHPTILVINPDPYPERPFGGADHAHDLRDLLRGEDYDLGSTEKMIEVRTWHELKKVVAAQTFDLVYFYGPAESDGDGTRLAFEADGGGGPDFRSVSSLAKQLRSMQPAPTLAYVNCCRGDRGGLLGIGSQLGSFIPSVITSRTTIRPPAAQKQARSLFRQLLLDSVPPHEAVASLHYDLSPDELEGVSPEWFTPVHFANYSAWNHVSPRDSKRPRIHPGWRWLLDRKNQYGTTTERLRSIVNRQVKKRALAIIAHGGPGNGLVHFQKRIRGFVHESVGVGGNTYQPSWPAYQARDETELALRDRSFLHIIESCGRPTLPELARDFRQGVVGSKALIVFNHAIVSRPEILNSRRLFEYIEWWDHQLTTEMDDHHLFFLYALYFEVGGAAAGTKKFRDRIKAARRQVQLQHIDVELLLPLTEIDEDDLLQFIDDHGLFIPQSRRWETAEYIIQQTGGEYEKAVRLLELLVQEQYHKLPGKSQPEQQADSSDDW